jgi:hypothetical protein
MIVVLGVIAAIANKFDKGKDQIEQGHDCSTCTAAKDESCKLHCLMEDVEKLKKSLAKERIKKNKSNLMPAKELKNTRSGMKRFNTNGPVHHKLAGGLEKKVKK